MKNVILNLLFLISSTVLFAKDDLPPCGWPTLNSVVVTSGNSATISWMASIGGVSPISRLQYSIYGSGLWVSASADVGENVTGNIITIISNLDAYTTYQVRVQTTCGSSLLYSINKPLFSTQSCANSITNLTDSSNPNNSTTLNWLGSSTELNYKLRNSATWISIMLPLSATSYTLSSLLPGQTYDWRLKSNCGNWTSRSFTQSLLCLPINLRQVASSGGTKTLYWDNCSPGTRTYSVQYRNNSDSPTWILTPSVPAGQTFIRIRTSGLCEWRVQEISPNLSDWVYKNEPVGLGCFLRLSLPASEPPINTLKTYPNPTTGSFTAEHPTETTHLEVLDLTGKSVWQSSTSGTQTQIDISEMPAGMYFVKTDNGMVQKIIKQ
jgi:hypothetical protein